MSSQEVGDIFGKGGGPAQAMLRSPTVLIVAVGLWGMNIFFFRLFGINYKYVLNYDLLKEEQEKGHHHHHHHHHPPLPPVVIGQPPPETGGGAGVAGAVAGKAVLPITITTTAPSSTGSLSLSGVTLLDTNSIRDVNNNNAAIMEDLLHNSKDNKMRLDFQDENKLLSTEAAAAAAAGGAGGAEITWYKLVIFSMILLILLHATTHFWMDALGRGVVGAVFLFYFSVLLYIFVPLSSNQWLRKAFRITLQRIYALIHPRCWCFRTLLPSSQMGGGGGGVVVVPRPIPFVDVFFADAMCSLSKVFFDWGMLLHMASHYPNPVPQDAHNIIVPSIFATIPFCIRARQCLLMWSIGRMQKDPNRHQHMANAIKYASSIWPLLLSAYQKTMSDSVAAQQLDIYLYILMTINALYALYWDIVMDWGMMQNPQAIVAQACAVTTSSLGSVGGGTTSSSSNATYDPLAKPTTSPKDDHHPHHHHHRSGSGRPSSSIPAMMDEWSKQAPSASKLKGGAGGSSFPKCHHLLLRPRLRFGLTMSALIVLSDAVLRFSWLLRFVSSHLFHSHDAFVLCTQFLEVFRRAIWNLLRVEWENIKQKSKQLKARDSLSDTEEDMNNNDHDYDYDHHDLSFTEQEQQEMIQLLQTPSSNNNNNNTSSSHGVELHHPLHAGSGGGGVPSSSSLAV